MITNNKQQFINKPKSEPQGFFSWTRLVLLPF